MDIYSKLQEIVKKKLKNKEVSPQDSLKDLGLDSLDKADIMIRIEDEFGIEFSEEEMVGVTTVEDLKNIIEKKVD